MMALASARLTNQCLFKHSSRNFPLKLAAYAFSIGLPGRMNNVHAVRVRPGLERTAGKLRPVVKDDRARQADRHSQVLEHADDACARQGSIHFEGEHSRLKSSTMFGVRKARL